jgi:hypothetical protein
MLSINYLTFRKNPCIEWFFDGLHTQCAGDYSGIEINVIDYFRNDPERVDYIHQKAYGKINHVAPKPTVWQGPYKLTQNEYFAASNARNTGICHSSGPYVAFIDDLSCMGPDWLKAALEAKEYIAMGMYEKVSTPVVDTLGRMVRYEPKKGCQDCRHGYAKDGEAVDQPGSLLYGCSVAGPIEAFLKVNGFDEDGDSTGLGTEDYICGMMMNQQGWKTKLDKRLWTYEWLEGHVQDRPFLRRDKGISPNDKSHAILNMVMGGRKYAPNYFGDGGIREQRRKVLAGESFPVTQVPDRDWYDGQPLSEL